MCLSYVVGIILSKLFFLSCHRILDILFQYSDSSHHFHIYAPCCTFTYDWCTFKIHATLKDIPKENLINIPYILAYNSSLTQVFDFFVVNGEQIIDLNIYIPILFGLWDVVIDN